ncbi:hypothetical protein SELMODRAFT_423380 [Selaginella moellendorffii]|uniref:Uncharacterized protein n=1 Tax=Selaginella moellendorffii TaxID=88036 RepID=D8SLI3_SELML|nr:hypothetical protein SELMODRAFT_423380 [Selaginella moellendorffii]
MPPSVQLLAGDLQMQQVPLIARLTVVALVCWVIWRARNLWIFQGSLLTVQQQLQLGNQQLAIGMLASLGSKRSNLKFHRPGAPALCMTANAFDNSTVEYRVPLQLHDHQFEVPLSSLTRCCISIFAREVVSGFVHSVAADIVSCFVTQHRTGLSLTIGSLSQLPSPKDQVVYLEHFQADIVVRSDNIISLKML